MFDINELSLFLHIAGTFFISGMPGFARMWQGLARFSLGFRRRTRENAFGVRFAATLSLGSWTVISVVVPRFEYKGRGYRFRAGPVAKLFVMSEKKFCFGVTGDF